MKIIDISDLKKKESPLHYRKEYLGTITMDIMQQTISSPLSFTIEHKPMGPEEIKIDIQEELDYPMLPVISAVKQHIRKLMEKGALP